MVSNYNTNFFPPRSGKIYRRYSPVNLAGNENMQEMWKANFSSLDKIKVIWLYPEEEQKWPNHQPLYEVNIYTISKLGSPYYGWDEGRNTRWITIASEEDKWKIVSIATGP